jgi:hypothetical protein
MRILLVNQGPLRGAESGLPFGALSDSLAAAGHEVRRLAVDSQEPGGDRVPTRRVSSRSGDPWSSLPTVTPQAGDDQVGARFVTELSDQQLTAYRDVLRQALDAEIDAFDPHIVHVQPIWVVAHLALEAGAPYVLTASGVELPVYRLDPRFRRLTEEAAENAGRIIALTEDIRVRMIAAFGELDGRVVALPAELNLNAAPQAETANWLTDIYRQVLTDRFGVCPEN